MGRWKHTKIHVWKPEDNLPESVFSPTMWDLERELRSLRLSSKHLDMLSHLAELSVNVIPARRGRAEGTGKSSGSSSVGGD